MTTETITVPAIQCEGCQISIEGALRLLQGVREARVDIPARQVMVNYDEALVTPSLLIRAIEDQGYDVPAQG